MRGAKIAKAVMGAKFGIWGINLAAAASKIENIITISLIIFNFLKFPLYYIIIFYRIAGSSHVAAQAV